jgi:hypothetical protein
MLKRKWALHQRNLKKQKNSCHMHWLDIITNIICFFIGYALGIVDEKDRVQNKTNNNA